MIAALLVGITFGLSAGFSLGPLMALIVAQTLQHNTKEGVWVATAPVLTDAPLVVASFFIINQLAALQPVLGVISLTGGVYVLYLSWETIRMNPIKMETSAAQPYSIRKGFLVNILNPHPYIFWITVGAPFSLKVYQDSPMAPWLFIISFYLLLTGSKVSIAIIAGRFRSFLKGRAYLIFIAISRRSAVCLRHVSAMGSKGLFQFIETR